MADDATPADRMDPGVPDPVGYEPPTVDDLGTLEELTAGVGRGNNEQQSRS